jgi:hypothetical protein
MWGSWQDWTRFQQVSLGHGNLTIIQRNKRHGSQWHFVPCLSIGLLSSDFGPSSRTSSVSLPPRLQPLCVADVITLRATGEQRNSFYYCEAKTHVKRTRMSERVRNWISGPFVLHNVIWPEGRDKTRKSFIVVSNPFPPNCLYFKSERIRIHV